MSLVQFRPEAYADLAHLVERNLAKVEVAGSSPVIRLKEKTSSKEGVFLFYMGNEDEKTPASFQLINGYESAWKTCHPRSG